MGRYKVYTDEILNIIYVLRCIPTGQEYIGQSTKGARYRKCVHSSYRAFIRRSAAAHGLTGDSAGEGAFTALRAILGRKATMPYLTAAIIAHPEDAYWEFEVLHELPEGSARDVLTPLEILEITNRGTLHPAGLNANLGWSLGEEGRELNRVHMTGKPKPESQKARMRESQLARWAVRREAAKAAVEG